MIQINEAMLEEVGLGGLPVAATRLLLERFTSELDFRVEERIDLSPPDQQADRFGQLFEADRMDEAASMLRDMTLDDDVIVEEEYETLKSVLRNAALPIRARAMKCDSNAMER